MLNKGLRDQESMRIDAVLRMLHSLIFMPKKASEEGKINIENQLKGFGLNIESLIEIKSNDLIELLGRLHFDWNQLEQFADFMIAFSKDNSFELTEKAIAIYEYIQSESKTFSFGIFNKIALAKANL